MCAAQIVCWNDGDTNSSYGRGDPQKDWSTDGGSLPSIGTAQASPLGAVASAATATATPTAAATPAATAADSEAASVASSHSTARSVGATQPKWSSRNPDGDSATSLRRDLTLVVVKQRAEAGSWAQALDPVTPLYVHLRLPSTKVRFYVATL